MIILGNSFNLGFTRLMDFYVALQICFNTKGFSSTVSTDHIILNLPNQNSFKIAVDVINANDIGISGSPVHEDCILNYFYFVSEVNICIAGVVDRILKRIDDSLSRLITKIKNGELHVEIQESCSDSRIKCVTMIQNQLRAQGIPSIRIDPGIIKIGQDTYKVALYNRGKFGSINSILIKNEKHSISLGSDFDGIVRNPRSVTEKIVLSSGLRTKKEVEKEVEKELPRPPKKGKRLFFGL
jgi:hypothetical protein